MHELGIVFHVIKEAEKVATENNVKEVVSLTLEVGEVSGVVLDYFHDCFEWAKKRSEFMKNCKLKTIVIEGLSYCKTCKETFKTTAHGKVCPHCGSKDTYLITGDQINIKDIQVI